MKNDIKEKPETAEHFITVIGSWANSIDGWFSKISYKKGVKYAKSWWEEAFEMGKEEQREEIKEKVEKMKKKFIEKEFYGTEEELQRRLNFEVGYNSALSDVISLLEKGKLL